MYDRYLLYKRFALARGTLQYKMSVPTYKLSKEQQEKTKKIFNAMDSDRSGFIEVRELGTVISTLETMGIAIDQKNLEIVVGKFDKTGKKRLNLEQFRYEQCFVWPKLILSTAKCWYTSWI